MKKIKFMLAAIVVVATVGGALAFKAKKFAVKYCTATQSGACSFGTIRQFDPLTERVWYTPTSNIDKCASSPVPQCTSSTSIRFED